MYRRLHAQSTEAISGNIIVVDPNINKPVIYAVNTKLSILDIKACNSLVILTGMYSHKNNK